MKTKKFKTSEIFNCFDCDESWEDYNTARKEAHNHAKKTGHKVTGEVVTAYHYNDNIKDWIKIGNGFEKLYPQNPK